MRVLRRGSAILVAGAGNREVARCDGSEVTFRGRRSTLCALDVWTRKDSWQAQGNREVVSCGRGECRCHIGIGV